MLVVEPLRTRSYFVPFAALLVACGGAPPPQPQAPADDPGPKLEAAKQTHAELAAELAKAPHDLLLHCQNHGGDCLISVAERRAELVSKHYLNPCRDPDPATQSPCVAQELERRGKRAELASYYETENWCSRKLLECMSAFVNDAEQAAIRKRAQERRAHVEAAPESAIAQRAPEFAKEKLAFVRSILPPKGQAECTPSPPEACAKKLDKPSTDLEAELDKAPASYDEKRALALYAALQRAEADCDSPELNCLLQRIPQYGGSAESDKLLKQNLSLIAQQQAIRAVADPERADQCLSAGVAQHSERIIESYQAYAAEPGSYAFLRLQKAFITMHQTQFWCLMPLNKKKR